MAPPLAGGCFRVFAGPDSTGVAGVAAAVAAVAVVGPLGAGAFDVAAFDEAVAAAVEVMIMSSRSKDRTKAPSRE